MARITLRSLGTAFLTLALWHAPLISAHADLYDDLLKDLKWRNVGPANMGGRIDDFAVVESDPRIVYMASAAGGLFKSVNAGTTWTPLFDDQTTSSIGDVAVTPSNPDIVWVGTGEANNRQSSSWGNGVYKSTDAGKTWDFVGLPDTHHIARIVVHPQNPDVVYVAALGRLWGPNKERGLFKTTDGGKTWQNVLFVNEDTGCTDVVMDPQNPDTLYAAMYQRRRQAFGFAGGGPNSGIHKSTDGGKTWKKLAGGLPTGDIGRIGLDVYRKNPKIVYAILETKNGSILGSNNGSVHRSEDGGETWTKVSDTNPRPMYYSQIRIDPTNDQNIWVLGAPLYFSENGGKDFTTRYGSRIHSDFHAMWINPQNADHILLGCDGGMQETHDRGKTWDYINTVPLSQFYEVTYDMRKPYYVYGGLQDNGSWGGPSATPWSEGPMNDEWYRIGGGDGFYVAVSPQDHNILYTESQNGAAGRINQRTGERKSITPREPRGETYQFDWNTPLLLSPRNPDKVFMAAQRLFISTDRGDSWRRTDDLTGKPDRTKMPIMGSPVTSKTLSANDGQDSFGQIVTVSESPLKEGVIYVGTDDGQLQISKDDGKTWENLAGKVPGVPKGTYVSRVHASPHSPGRVYATFDNHRYNDFTPYLFVSEDYGQTWKRLGSSALPEGSTLHVIRDHPRNPNLLFAGTERGLYISFDRGAQWKRFSYPLPTVPVDDIQIHSRDNDLILGTHGRGVYILDDIAFLEQAEAAQSYNLYLCTPRPAVMYRISQRKNGFTGHKVFMGDNPDRGASIQFFLKNKPADGEEAKLTILDRDGKNVIREIPVSRLNAGLNRVTWDMRHGSPTADLEGGAGGRPGGRRPDAAGGAPAGAGTPAGAPAGGQGAGARGARGGGRGGQGGGGGQGGPGGGGGGGGFRGGGFGPRGPRVMPGVYLARLTFGKEEQTKPITVEEDPRLEMTLRERKTYFDAQMKIAQLTRSSEQTRRTLQNVRTQVTSLQEKDTTKSAPQPVKDAIAELSKKIDTLQTRLAPRFGRGGGPGGPGGGGAPRPAGESNAEGAAARPEGAPAQPAAAAPTTAAPEVPVASRIQALTFSLESLTEVPSRSIQQDIKALSEEMSRLVQEVNALNLKAIPDLNRQLKSAQLPLLTPERRVALSDKLPTVGAYAAEIVANADDEEAEREAEGAAEEREESEEAGD